MATYTGVVRSKEATLVAATVDTIAFADAAYEVEIVNQGTTHIYARFDGTDPAVGGDDATLVRSGDAVQRAFTSAVAAAKLISSGGAKYILERLR